MKVKSTNLIISMLVIQLVLSVMIIVQLNNISDNTAVFKALLGEAPEAVPTDVPQPTQVEVSADDDPAIGPKNAKVTVIEFSDFQCPYCGAAMGTQQALIERFKSSDPTYEPAVPKLKELAKQGKIRLVFRDFPLSFHENAQKAAEAAECADEQGKFWEYHDKLYENQEALDIASLKKYASELKLDTNKFNECLDSGKMTAEVRKDFNDGQKYGVAGTPAFFVNGEPISGAVSFAVFEQVIEAALANN